MNLTAPQQEAESPRLTLTTALADRVPIAVVALLAILQMVLFVFTGAPAERVAGLTLGVGVVAWTRLPGWPRRLRAWGLGLLSGAIAINLAYHLVSAAPPFPYRLLQVAVVLGYAAVMVAGALTLVFRMKIADALLLTLSVASIFFGGEVVIQRSPLLNMINAVEWIGGTVPHPVLGFYYPPNSFAKTIYPDNPRHYFDEPDPRLSLWHLDIQDRGSAARLAFPDSHGPEVHVEIDRAPTPVLWHIQLREPGLAIQANTAYEVRFRARSEAPRKFAYGLTQAHAPWQTVGLYQEAELDQSWREFKQPFTPSASEPNAQLHFDLGGSAASVDFADVVVRRRSDGSAIEAPARREYSVSYRFNALGCRGRDYAIPHPPNTRRIVVLGDSFAVGIGVHERDTFEARLEQGLNARRNASATQYEVINCGVSGFSPRYERLLYEMTASRYDPDVVLVEMASNRDISWHEEVTRGYFHTTGKAEYLFRSWHAFQFARYEGRRPAPDFHLSVGELLQLQEDCRRQHAKLAIAFFRPAPLTRSWRNLMTTVNSGVEGKGIPTVDLGTGMFPDHTTEQLMVHPKFDPHPNEIAHGIAAQELEDFLRREHLLD